MNTNDPNTEATDPIKPLTNMDTKLIEFAGHLSPIEMDALADRYTRWSAQLRAEAAASRGDNCGPDLTSGLNVAFRDSAGTEIHSFSLNQNIVERILERVREDMDPMVRIRAALCRAVSSLTLLDVLPRLHGAARKAEGLLDLLAGRISLLEEETNPDGAWSGSIESLANDSRKELRAAIDNAWDRTAGLLRLDNAPDETDFASNDQKAAA